MKRPLTIVLATLGLAAFATMVSPRATADDSLWYVGGNFGKSKASIDDVKITSSLLSEGFTTTSLGNDNDATGFKLFAGYRFNKFFALEGGYFDLGKFGFTANTTPAGTLHGDVKFRGLNLDLVGSVPIGDQFSLFVRGGVIDAEAKGAFSGTGAVTVINPSPKKRAVGYKFGGGFGIDFTPAFGMRIEAERYRMDDAVGNKGDIDLYSAGLLYRFGASSPVPAYVAPAVVATPAPPPPPIPVQEPAPQPAPPPPPPPPPPRRVSFSADALFTFNESVVRPEGVHDIEKFAAELRGTTYDQIYVYGYTDRIGSDAYNQKLSQRRADAVKSILIEAAKLDGAKVQAEGRGEIDPVTKPGQCEGKRSPKLIACLQPDRRVDIEVRGTRH